MGQRLFKTDGIEGMLVATTVRLNPAMGDLTLLDPTTGTRTAIGVAPPGGWGTGLLAVVSG